VKIAKIVGDGDGGNVTLFVMKNVIFSSPDAGRILHSELFLTPILAYLTP
jgi:hypothetical protein